MIMTYVFVVSYNFSAVLLKYLLCFFPSEDPIKAQKYCEVLENLVTEFVIGFHCVVDIN